MKAFLVQQEVHGVIDSGDLLEKATQDDKKIKKKAFISILSNLFDKIFREVSKETTPKKVFSKHNSLYLQKYLY